MWGVLIIAGGVLAFGLGIYIGLGAPGWPVPPEARPRRLEKRALNPLARGRITGRERLSLATSTKEGAARAERCRVAGLPRHGYICARPEPIRTTAERPEAPDGRAQ